MRKKSTIALMILIMGATSLVTGVSAQETQEEIGAACENCLQKRRKKVRTCLRIFGKFDNGSKGGFFSTGNKTVCVKDPVNQCDSNELTGCIGGD